MSTPDTCRLPEPTSEVPEIRHAVWDVQLGGVQLPPWPQVIASAGLVDLPPVPDEGTVVTAEQAEEYALAVLAAARYAKET